jgi:hypothetical protein
MLINISAIHGEEGTGFEKDNNKGEFECGNCRYFANGNACTQKDMKAKSKQPRHPNGDVVVDEEDCCEFVDRIGKIEDDEKEEDMEHSNEEKSHFHRAMSHLNQGGLHRALGVAEDKPLTMEQKQKAASSSNKHMAAMGRMAVAMHGWESR